MLRRLGVIAAVAGALVLGVATAGLAHGDDRLATGPFTVGPGGTVSFEGEVHYHRLTARVDADGPVIVRFVEAASGRLAAAAGPATSIRMNELIRCCDDTTWTSHRLEIANPAGTAVAGSVTATLVHDDLAVMVFTAESGTRESVVILGLALVALLWRSTRRRPDRALRPATVGAGVLGGGVVVLAAVGTSAYGTGGPPALLAVLAHVPVVPFNTVVSRASLLLGATMFGWGWATVRWAAARPGAATRPWVATGAVLAAMPVATAALMIRAYGTWPMAVAMALAAAAPATMVLLRGAGMRTGGDAVHHNEPTATS